jgi:hypothetical protein
MSYHDPGELVLIEAQFAADEHEWELRIEARARASRNLVASIGELDAHATRLAWDQLAALADRLEATGQPEDVKAARAINAMCNFMIATQWHAFGTDRVQQMGLVSELVDGPED